MTSPRFVYVVESRDTDLQTALDVMRLIANPRTRRRAHLTLRGPYEKPLPSQTLASMDAILDKIRVRVHGVGNFFDEGQGTVFFACDATRELLRVWDKPALSQVRPHITVFDGSLTSAFTKRLYECLAPLVPDFSFRPSELRLAEIGKRSAADSAMYALEHPVARAVLGGHPRIWLERATDDDRITAVVQMVEQSLRRLSARTD